jgi:hypothetical protein
VTKLESRRVELKVVPRVRPVIVKVPKFPEADAALKHKIRVHILCVLTGGILAVIMTYVSDGLVHWVPFIPTVPNVVYEVLDRINDR